MYKTLIVDDNKVARAILSEMLKKTEGVEIAGEIEDAPSAITFLKKNEIDILFLDVELPGMSGLELLRVVPERPVTILVSAQAGYAVEAFELNVIDYLVKPFTVYRLMLAVEKAIELLKMKNVKVNQVDSGHIFIKDGKVIRKILIQHILWLEAKGDYVKIVTENGNYVIHATLRNLEEKLSAAAFVRIHRGFVIPTGKIDYIEDGAVYIQGSTLPVSENYKTDLLKSLRLL